VDGNETFGRCECVEKVGSSKDRKPFIVDGEGRVETELKERIELVEVETGQPIVTGGKEIFETNRRAANAESSKDRTANPHGWQRDL
jgi:hypothetical protein